MIAITKQNRALKQLLWIGIGSISMFFAGLTSAYIVRKAEGNWTEIVLPEWFFYSTIIIIISSLLLVFAKRQIKKNTIPFNAILFAFFLGLIFLLFQFNGWKSLVDQGIFLTGEGSNVAGSFLYVLTLAHLAHLIGGLVVLTITLFKCKRMQYSKDNYLGMSLGFTYWHFLTILWIYLFFFLKYL
ncbi:MAG: cytochrome oxidase subunit III [Flavobacteriales bacterium]|nr:cytochrome oxidase subunit III [Flavobacteriales bacterium]